MPPFRRGKPISANALNRAADDAKRGATLTSRSAIIRSGPGGQSVVIPKLKQPLPEGACWVQYKGTDSIGRYQLAEIYGAWTEAQYGLNILLVRKPTIPGNNMLVIMREGLQPNAIGQAQYSGQYPVVHCASNGGAAVIDQNFGTFGSISPYAHTMPIGPMKYIQTLNDAYGNGDVDDGGSGSAESFALRLLMVELTRERGETMAVDYADFGADEQVWSVWYFDNNYVVTGEAHGMVGVTLR